MMFAFLPLFAGLSALQAPTSASPLPLCGGADFSRDTAAMTLRFLGAPADLHSPYVHVKVRNEDGSYSFSVSYRPTEQGLGKPHMVHVDTLVSFPSDADVRPLRLEWRAPGEAWSSPLHWSTPQRFSSSREIRFRANYRLGQGAPFPHSTEVLDNLAKGVRYEFRSVDQSGETLSAGSASYPPRKVIEEMYSAAREQALARLEPCNDGPAPKIVPVAPAARSN
jgi:hypothetical protein